MWVIKAFFVFSAALFVGLTVISAIFAKGELTADKLVTIAFASLGTAAVFFGPLVVYHWARGVKDQHESTPNDGSLRYRFSQARYIFAILVIGLMSLVVLYAVFHHRGRW